MSIQSSNKDTIEYLSPLLAFCAGNPTVDSPHEGPVMRKSEPMSVGQHAQRCAIICVTLLSLWWRLPYIRVPKSSD